MTCPKCLHGVLESYWFLDFNENFMLPQKIDSHEVREIEKSEIGLLVYICSKQNCNYTEMKATPETLPQAKREVREFKYSVGSRHT